MITKYMEWHKGGAGPYVMSVQTSGRVTVTGDPDKPGQASFFIEPGYRGNAALLATEAPLVIVPEINTAATENTFLVQVMPDDLDAQLAAYDALCVAVKEKRRQLLERWIEEKSPYPQGFQFQRAFHGVATWRVMGASVEWREVGWHGERSYDWVVVYEIKRVRAKGEVRQSTDTQRVPAQNMATIVNSVS